MRSALGRLGGEEAAAQAGEGPAAWRVEQFGQDAVLVCGVEALWIQDWQSAMDGRTGAGTSARPPRR
ncbi:hypothetical protein ABT213_33465 [Streptomyces sp. NPDC001674]|uniref:hypothetical protein n=1 Tax=Streptomyces sp. NPDC001674 TaxID=3154394 RepID=UPI003318B2A9